MFTGYYKLQRECNAQGRSFFDELDAIEADLGIPVSGDDPNETATVSVYSFLHGYCLLLAKHLHKLYGMPIGILFDGEDYVHAYNYIDQDGRRLYLDARGYTDSFHLFADPFISGAPREVALEDSSVEAQLPEWAQKEDAITDAMLDWLLSGERAGWYAPIKPSL